MYIIVGLGNPGEEYEDTRHNTGRMMLEFFRRVNGLPDWQSEKKVKAQSAKGKIAKENLTLLLPDTFMNKSGTVLPAFIKSVKQAQALVVIHDDLDLPLGRFKISYNRGAGGHRGVESIIRTLKTEQFTRIRVGISKAGAKGTVKKPHGEKAVNDFILEKFKKPELAELKKVSKKVAQALEMIVTGEREKAMGMFN